MEKETYELGHLINIFKEHTKSFEKIAENQGEFCISRALWAICQEIEEIKHKMED